MTSRDCATGSSQSISIGASPNALHIHAFMPVFHIVILPDHRQCAARKPIRQGKARQKTKMKKS
jgi:hypothetical protein